MAANLLNALDRYVDLGGLLQEEVFLIKKVVSHGELTPGQKVERKASIQQNEHHIINAWDDILSNKF